MSRTYRGLPHVGTNGGSYDTVAARVRAFEGLGMIMLPEVPHNPVA